MAEQLQIQVQANVSNAITNLNNLQKELAETNTAAVKTGTTGMQTLSKGAGQANTAMINLGRTVSDAPFGFIGIANNIGPLVENFASLKKESGSTGNALRQLGSSLIGPGGLIVGVQLAVAAIQFIQLGFSRWTGSTKKQKEETEKLNDSLDQIANTLAKENFEISRLSELIKRQTATRAEQLEAYKKLNEIAPEYFGKLNNEKNIIEQTANAYFLYQKGLLNTFKIKAQEEELLNLSKELLRIEKELLKFEKTSDEIESANNKLLIDSLRNIAREKQGLSKLPISTDRSRKLIIDENKQIITQDLLLKQRTETQLKYNNLLAKIPKIDPKELKLQTDKQSKQKTLQEKINDLLEDYNTTIKELDYEQQITGLNKSNERLNTNFDFLKRIAILGGETSKAYAEIASKTQGLADAASKFKIDELIKNYQTAISELDIKQAVTGQDQLNARINAATDALIKLKTLGVEPTNEEFIKLQNTLNGLQAEVGLREIRKRTEEITKTWERFQLQVDKLNFNKTKEPLDALKSKIDLIGNAIQELKSKGLTDKDLGISILSIQFEQLGKQFEKLKAQKELFDQLQQTISGGLTNAFTSVFEAIADGEDAFKALGDSIKRLALDLIRVVIQMQVVKALSNIIAPGSGKLFASNEFQTLIRGDTIRRLFVR